MSDEIEEFEPASDLVGMTELGRAIICSTPTIRHYIQMGMPYVTKGDRNTGTAWQFSLSECREWIADRDAELQAKHSKKQQEQEEDAGIVAARIAKLNVETQRLELRLARERGELVPIDRVAEIVESQMTTLRTHLLALPIKLAPVLVGHDVDGMKEKITAYIREALEELAEDKVLEQVTPDQVDELVHDEAKAHPLDALLEVEDATDGN